MHTFMRSGAIVFVALLMPFSTFAYVEYGAYYYTPGYAQMYYQPMYAYSYSPQQSMHQNTYIQYPQYQQQPAFAYGAPQYGYGYPQQQYPQPYNYYPQYNYAPQYSYGYYPQQNYGYSQYHYPSQWGPSGYGYPTGDTVPWIGGPLCEFPDYDGRALCGSNPNQWVYDPWTGSWY